VDFGEKVGPFQSLNPLNHFGRKWKFVAHVLWKPFIHKKGEEEMKIEGNMLNTLSLTDNLTGSLTSKNIPQKNSKETTH